MSSRVASISSFSANGSPTWTRRALARGPGRRTSRDASTDAPPIPSRPVARAVQDDEVARAVRGGVREHPVLEQADRHDVDQRVALVGRIEHELAAHRGHADAVAVAADAAHDAVDEVPRAGVRRIAEAQRVEHRDRAGAHREDVAQDAADAGRGALVRLHRGRVVVALDLERDREAVADRDHARLLADARDDVLALGRAGSSAAGGELLYEQCSLHITLNIASSRPFGSRPELPADRVELDVGEAQRAVERDGLGGHAAPPATVAAPTGAGSRARDPARLLPTPPRSPRASG